MSTQEPATPPAGTEPQPESLDQFKPAPDPSWWAVLAWVLPGLLLGLLCLWLMASE